MFQWKYFPSSWSTANNNEAKKSKFVDVHDRRISSDENGASSACIPKDDPFLAADSVIDDQKETRTVVNETPKKEEGIEEGANNTSNEQSSTQSKSKKRKKKIASKGTPRSAGTINKDAEEIKVEKEGMILLNTSLTSSIYTLVWGRLSSSKKDPKKDRVGDPKQISYCGERRVQLIWLLHKSFTCIGIGVKDAHKKTKGWTVRVRLAYQ